MSERFFLETPPGGGRAVLTGDEARHLARVMRASVGDRVELFDGLGHAWLAEVRTLGRGQVELDLLKEELGNERCAAGQPAAAAIRSPLLTIAAALPKGDRQKWMVEKLTELAAHRLMPLATARSVAEATPSAIARLQRQVIEACKQCRRNQLLEITEPMRLQDVCGSRDADTLGLLTDPTGQPAARLLASQPTNILALVGPEGGFTDDERQLALDAGFTPIRLGPHILRVETAAVAIAAAINGAAEQDEA
jgi:16S rRNA (uracil1498-N3)-methyltransferase